MSSCVFLCPPVERETSREYSGNTTLKPALIFGNITRESFADIWNQPEYRAFRKKFSERAQYYDRRLSGLSCSLAGSEKLQAAVKDTGRYFASHPVPQHCTCCARIDGF